MRWPLRTPSTWQRHPSSRPTTTTDHPEEQVSTAATDAPCSALEKERVESRTTEGAADLRAELAQGLGDRLGPAVTMATTEHFNRCTGGTTCARETLTSLRRSIGSPPSSQVLTRPRMAPPLVLSEATLVREAGRSDGSRDDQGASAAAGPRSRQTGAQHRRVCRLCRHLHRVRRLLPRRGGRAGVSPLHSP
jgi:hypothetical protein